MGKQQTSSKGKPRSAGSSKAKTAYYWSHNFAPNMARRAFRLYKRTLKFEKRREVVISNAHNIALASIRSRKHLLTPLIETFYLKAYKAYNS